MHPIRLPAAVLLATTGLTCHAGAAGPSTPALSSATAMDAAIAAKDSCSKMGFHVAVTIVDAAGVVLVTLRDDGAAPHTVGTSQKKAYTALSSRMPTSQLTRIVVTNPDAAGLRDIDGFLVLAGGLPIKSADAVVGAIGVSGSPGPDGDEKCGGAGLAAIAARLGK